MVDATIEINGEVISERQLVNAYYVTQALNLTDSVKEKCKNEISLQLMRIKQIDLFDQEENP